MIFDFGILIFDFAGDVADAVIQAGFRAGSGFLDLGLAGRAR
jgi:hypothetical protein